MRRVERLYAGRLSRDGSLRVVSSKERTQLGLKSRNLCKCKRSRACGLPAKPTGEGGIRTPGTIETAHWFSKPAPSAARTPLLRHLAYGPYYSRGRWSRPTARSKLGLFETCGTSLDPTRSESEPAKGCCLGIPSKAVRASRPRIGWIGCRRWSEPVTREMYLEDS